MALLFNLLVQEDAQCQPGSRYSTLVRYWRLLRNSLRLIRKLGGQPPKSFQSRTHLEVSDISRGQSRDAEKHCCCSLQCFTAETVSGPSPTCTPRRPARQQRFLSAYSASLTRLRSPPSSSFLLLSLASAPPAEMQNAHLCCRDLPC